MNKETNLIKNTAALTICSIFNKGIMFVMVPFFSRWLTTENYGTFDVLTTYVTLLIPIITLACSDAIFRLSIDDEDNQSSYIFSGFVLFAINLVIASIIIFIVSKLIGWNTVVPFIGLLIGETVDNFIQGYLRAIRKINLYAIGKLINNALIVILVIVFVLFLKMGLWGITFGYALGYLVGDAFLLLYTRFNKYLHRSLFSFPHIISMIKYSLPLIPNNISWWVVNVSDRIVINSFLGATANGVYAIAYKIPNLCSAILGVFGISWQEAAIDALNDENRSIFYNKVYNKLLSVILSICIGILSCSHILFYYIFDIKYVNARFYAPLLVFAIVITQISTFFGGIQISLKQPGKNGLSTVIGAVVNIIVHLALIRVYGLYAACISTVVSDIVVFIIRKIQLRKYATIKTENINFVWLGIFLIFLASCYFELNLVWGIVLVVVASILFIIINKDILRSVISKILGKVHVKEH